MPEVRVEPENIPDELKARDQWLLWDASNDTPRQPHWRGDFYISWSDPADWHTFEEAVEAAQDTDSWGIGYVMAADNDDHARGLYGVIDIDGCTEDEHGDPKDWVPSLDTFGESGAYIEWSPSATGLHIPIVGADKPDWWSDQHFTDDEHEGVELLTNKFCTFTGDTLRGSQPDVVEWSDDVENWLIEAYKSVTGEDPTKSKSADFDDAGDGSGGRANREEFLDEDDIRDALDYVNPDTSYDTWRDIGFALSDFFSSDHTALSVFRDWSRSGSKWDSEAEDLAERIIRDSTSGGGRTIGTIIHHARAGGWELPISSSNSTDPAENPPEPVDVDEDEVERGKKILETQCDPENPPRELKHKNNCYGYEKAYKDEDGNVTNVVWDSICNFTLETVSVLKTDSGDEFRIAVHPQSPREDTYEVRVDPTVFNSPQTFKEEIVCGRTTWFRTSTRRGMPTETILSHLRELVGQQDAPIRDGTEFIGLSPDRNEWVTPYGSIGADGWVDDPHYEFYSKAGEDDQTGSLAQKWSLNPEDGTDYDESEVRRICELLPQTRKLERGLPILGWFYSAPLRPLIHDEFGEGEFNLLQVYADSGAGKTTTLESYWKAFGGGSDPYGANDTSFTIEKHMTESCGLPVWYDEYKPAEMPQGDLDRLHRALKKVTKGASLPKGTADMGEITFELRAPVVISGEQKFQDPAIRRRTVMTNLTAESTRAGSDTVAAFGQLTGASYEDGDGDIQTPDGCDLEEHARAYYQYLLRQDIGDLERLWAEASSRTNTFLERLDVQLDDTEQQGVQTIVFGVSLYRQFADTVGVSDTAMPTESDVLDAVEHVIGNIGKDGSRREHADDYLELATLAASEDYIEQGFHYKTVNSPKYDETCLAIHMPSTFSAIKKFVREYNLEDEYTILSKNDYNTSFSNKSDQEDTYVAETNKKTRGLEGNRAVHFLPSVAEDKLPGDFRLSAFTKTDDEDDEEAADTDDDPDNTALADLEPGYQTITAEVASEVDPKPWLQAEGTLKDESGIVDYVARGDTNPAADVEQGNEYRFENAKIEYDEHGQIVVELRDGVSEVSLLKGGGSQSGLDKHGDGDAEAAADGGVTSEAADADLDKEEAVKQETIRNQNKFDGPGVPEDELIEAVVERGLTEAKAEAGIENLLDKGEIYEPKDGYYEAT